MQFFIESCPEPLPVYLDAVELRQVVINLVLNAIEAMPPEGSLTLRTSTGGGASLQTRSHGTFPGGPTACLSIIDTGPGIKPGHLANIFDPFFSTKQTNKGSGLGLYNARVFVQRHRGAISVETREGDGATFQLWLPQADFTELGPGLPPEAADPQPRPFCDI
jgi:signal transduction histidine kinase